MFGFGKKYPLYERVRKSDISELFRLLDASKGNPHPDLLAISVGYLIENLASHMVKDGPPVNHKKKINADVFTFEILAYSMVLLQRAVFKISSYEIRHLEDQYALGEIMLFNTVDRLTGWTSNDVLIARFDEYNRPDANGLNLASTLMTVGSAEEPLHQYLNPLDFQSQIHVIPRIMELHHLGSGPIDVMRSI